VIDEFSNKVKLPLIVGILNIVRAEFAPGSHITSGSMGRRRVRGTHRITEVLIKGFATPIKIGPNKKIRNWLIVRTELERESERIRNSIAVAPKEPPQPPQPPPEEEQASEANVWEDFQFVPDDADSYDHFAFDDFTDISPNGYDGTWKP
jgi:hypothetical protein